MGEDLDKEILDLCLEILEEGLDDEDSKTVNEDPFFENLSAEARLDELVRRGSHFPSPELTDLLKMKCHVHLQRGEHGAAAVALLHSQGLLFRHQALAQYNKRLRRREEERAKKKGANANVDKENSDQDLWEDEEDEEERAEKVLKRSLAFQDLSAANGGGEGVEADRLEEMASALPEEWRVLQISTKPDFSGRFRRLPAATGPSSGVGAADRNPALLLTAVRCGPAPSFRASVVEVPPLENGDRPTVMAELADVVERHRMVYQRTERYEKATYDSARDELDDRMRSLLASVQDRYLGWAKTLLLGRRRDPSGAAAVQAAAEKLLKKLRVPVKERGRKACVLEALLDGAHLMEQEQLARGCLQITDKPAKVKELVAEVAKFSANNKPEGDDEGSGRCPVVLILDKDVQGLPWESLGVVRRQPCSRVPSLFFLSALYEMHDSSRGSVARSGVRNENIFYVLNPNQDLKKTQARLEERFRSMSLGDGVVGSWPSPPRLRSALTGADAFMYCGHGSRLKTMSGQDIERLRVRAVPLLFGCNSGRLERVGSAFDPVGGAHSYLVAASPCLLGFLWSVTDLDVDRWTVRFLEHWLGNVDDAGGNTGEKDFVRAVAQKRGDFARFLNGSAAVVYGLPAFLDSKDVK